MFVAFFPSKTAIGRIDKIAKKPIIDATSQFLGHIEINKDFCSNERKVTIALINIVTKIAENKVIINNENIDRDIKKTSCYTVFRFKLFCYYQIKKQAVKKLPPALKLFYEQFIV